MSRVHKLTAYQQQRTRENREHVNQIIALYQEELKRTQQARKTSGLPQLPSVTPSSAPQTPNRPPPVSYLATKKFTPRSLPCARKHNIICDTEHNRALRHRHVSIGKTPKRHRINWIRIYNVGYPLYAQRKKVVHHMIERCIASYYKEVVDEKIIHDVTNLTGIPKAKNRWLHLSVIGSVWGWFICHHPYVSQRQLCLFTRCINHVLGAFLLPQINIPRSEISNLDADPLFQKFNHKSEASLDILKPFGSRMACYLSRSQARKHPIEEAAERKLKLHRIEEGGIATKSAGPTIASQLFSTTPVARSIPLATSAPTTPTNKPPISRFTGDTLLEGCAALRQPLPISSSEKLEDVWLLP